MIILGLITLIWGKETKIIILWLQIIIIEPQIIIIEPQIIIIKAQNIIVEPQNIICEPKRRGLEPQIVRKGEETKGIYMQVSTKNKPGIKSPFDDQ